MDKPLDIADHRQILREKQVVVDFSHLLVSRHIPLEAIARAQPISRTAPERPCPLEASRNGEECPADTFDLIETGAHKHAKLRCQQLIYTDTSPIRLLRTIRGRKRTHARPQAIVPLNEEG